MVIAQRQLAVLAVEAVSAQVVLAGRADTVTSPVTEGADDLIEQRVIGIDSTALAHGHMVRRIEAGGSDIAHGSGKLLHAVQCIAASQCITVVLDEPQVMAITELLHCL